jgi:hypothetical protein
MKLTDPASRWLVWPALSLALVAAAGAGRWFDPPTITETKSDVRIVTREVVRWKTRATKDTYEKRTPVAIATPDGGITIANVVERSTRELTSSEGESKRDALTDSKSYTKSGVDLSRYRVGLQVGATWREPAIPIAGPLVVGATAEARIGNLPIWLGAWGGTYNAAGISLSGEF